MVNFLKFVETSTAADTNMQRPNIFFLLVILQSLNRVFKELSDGQLRTSKFLNQMAAVQTIRCVITQGPQVAQRHIFAPMIELHL